jgi:hypothetical protein
MPPQDNSQDQPVQNEITQEMRNQYPSMVNKNTAPDKSEINMLEAEIASLNKSLVERDNNIVMIDNWFAQQDPMAGEYQSFLDQYTTLASTLGNFRKVYSVDKQADQKNINYEGDYYNNLFEQSDAAPTPYGEALKHPEKYHDETSKDMQKKWRKILVKTSENK